MRKRWRRDDTPVTVKALIAVIVLGWFGILAWWDYEKHHDTWGDWYWPITIGPLALFTVVILVGLGGAWFQRRRKRRARDERVRHGDSGP